MAQTKEGIRKIRAKHGKHCFRDWGKKGGNPLLIEQGKKKGEVEKENR